MVKYTLDGNQFLDAVYTELERLKIPAYIENAEDFISSLSAEELYALVLSKDK